MQLEHLNLVVSDINKSLEFYNVMFPNWRIRSQGKAQWYGIERNWVHFGDDYNYLTFNDKGVGKNRDLTGHQIGLAHFAYRTENLNALVTRMTDAGYAPHNVGTDNPFRKNAYFIDHDGYEIEFVEYLSDLPEQRNNDD